MKELKSSGARRGHPWNERECGDGRGKMRSQPWLGDNHGSYQLIQWPCLDFIKVTWHIFVLLLTVLAFERLIHYRLQL